MQDFPLFLITAPGLEGILAREAEEIGLTVTGRIPGGVEATGGWAEIYRANLRLRGATRVLMRIDSFPAVHLAQLDKRLRRVDWAKWLPGNAAIRVEASCRKSRIYHDRAAAQRLEKVLSDMIDARKDREGQSVRLRIEDDICTISLDTSGASLHKRGHKEQINKAPMRETLAALFLRQAGYYGDKPVYDPMCGSGTFPIEAAEVAMGLDAGRAREFACQSFPGFDESLFEGERTTPQTTPLRFFGSDRDAGAIEMSRANAARAGVDGICSFEKKPISDITPPCEPPGVVILNPPYGSRIGEAKPLFGLYGAMGRRLKEQFAGWKVAVITSDKALAQATALPFQNPGPVVNHGGIKVRLWQTGALP